MTSISLSVTATQPQVQSRRDMLFVRAAVNEDVAAGAFSGRLGKGDVGRSFG
jgi:hypothetical protein